MEDLGGQARLTLEVPFLAELEPGESVAVNGCCLTVSGLENGVGFDVLTQTLKVTALGGLEAGSVVNLERALRVGDRLGGHMVQGHVDGTGEIVGLEKRGQDHVLRVSLPPEVREFCIVKGSLTVDGISLTIAEIGESVAEFWITPHTWVATNLNAAEIGGKVNLEADMVAKYVKSLFPHRE